MRARQFASFHSLLWVLLQANTWNSNQVYLGNLKGVEEKELAYPSFLLRVWLSSPNVSTIFTPIFGNDLKDFIL